MNKKIISGRLGKDGVLKRTQSGVAILELSVADAFKQKDNQFQTSWWRINLWGKQAEKYEPHCKKGVEIVAFGRDENREYEDRNGAKKFAQTLQADYFRVCVSVESNAIDVKETVATKEQSSNYDEYGDIPF